MTGTHLLTHRGRTRFGLPMLAVILALAVAVSSVIAFANPAPVAHAATGPCGDLVIAGSDGRAAGRHQTVTQVNVSSAICELEQRVIAEIAADRGVPLTPAVRAEILSYGRNEVRTRLLLELTRLLDVPGPARDAVEQGSVDWFAERYRDFRLDAADSALAEYDEWKADPCNYEPPGEHTYDVPAAECTGLSMLWSGGPRPPKYESFVTYGVEQANGGGAEIDFVTDYIASLLTATAVLGAALGVASQVVPLVATSFALMFLPYSSALTGAAAGVLGGGLFAATVFAIVVITVVGSIVRGIQVAKDKQIRPRLEADRTLALAIDEYRLHPAVADDSTASQVLTAYLFGVSPDVLPPTLAPLAAAPPADAPQFVTTAAEGTTLVTSTSPTFDVLDHDGVLNRVWVKDRWFVVQPVDGSSPPTLTPTLSYFRSDGIAIVARFDGDVLVLVEAGGGAPVPNCDSGLKCTRTDTLAYLSDAGGDGGVSTVSSRFIGRLPVITSGPLVTGDLTEGSTITMSVEADDPEGGPLKYVWSLTRDGLGGERVTSVVTGAATIEQRLVGDGAYDISIAVIDQQGGEAQATTSITVAPNVGLLGARTLRLASSGFIERPLIENTPGRFEVTATADDRVRVDWDDDGTTDATLVAGPTGVATFDTPAFDEGIHPVSVVVDSGEGTAATTEVFPIDVVNALPTDLVVEVHDPATDTWRAMPEAPVPGAPRDGRPAFHEGDIVRLRMSATDAGNDQLTFVPYHKVGDGFLDYGAQPVVVDEGDGIVETSFRLADQVEFLQVPPFDFPPAVLVSVTDSDTWISSQTGRAYFHIDNVAPVVEQVDQVADDQGGIELRAVVSDAGGAIDDVTKIEIDWGDGSDVEDATLGLLGDDDTGDVTADIIGSAAHRYAGPGTYAASITAYDDVTSTTESVDIVVPAFAPVIGEIVELDVGSERTPTQLGVVVSDVDTDLDDVVVTVEWGDGTTSEATLDTGTFVASHTFATAGSYDATIAATDGTLEAEPFEGTLLVGDVAPSVVVEQAESQDDPTAGDVTFDVVFSEPVTGFESADVELSGSAGATTATVTDSGDATTYAVVVSGMTSTGTVIASIAAGAATDAQGSESAASVSTDNSVRFIAPMRVLTPPGAAITADNDAGLAGAIVEFDVSVDGGSGGALVSCDPMSGSFFPIGETTVTCTATEASLELTARTSLSRSELTMPAATATFSVTVRDVEGPALSASPVAPAAVMSVDGSPVAVSYTLPTVTDNSGVVEEMSCRPPSGSMFAVGSTTVTCSASDAAGNTLTTTFDVVVDQAPTGGAAAPSGSDLDGSLPATGSGVNGVIMRAFVLLLLGLMLVLSTRRRLGRRAT